MDDDTGMQSTFAGVQPIDADDCTLRSSTDNAFVSLRKLFQITVPTVNEHLKDIFEQGELEENPSIREFRIVRSEGICGYATSSP